MVNFAQIVYIIKELAGGSTVVQDTATLLPDVLNGTVCTRLSFLH